VTQSSIRAYPAVFEGECGLRTYVVDAMLLSMGNLTIEPGLW